jgi:hypothetical protein
LAHLRCHSEPPSLSFRASLCRSEPLFLSFRAEGEESPVQQAAEIPRPRCARARDDNWGRYARPRDDTCGAARGVGMTDGDAARPQPSNDAWRYTRLVEWRCVEPRADSTPSSFQASLSVIPSLSLCRSEPLFLSFRAEGEESPVQQAAEIPRPRCARARADKGTLRAGSG